MNAAELRRASLECSGWEPSLSVLQRAADEAADLIESQQATIQSLRDALEKAHEAIRAARAMVPDEEEGLAAQIFAQRLNRADEDIVIALMTPEMRAALNGETGQ